MLTLFSTAKPFLGHSGVIQRNAVQSWKLLHPDVEIILFGDDEGAAEVARELGIRHEPHVERTEFGRKCLDYMFNRAQAIARHDTLCYINCDIILTSEFREALECVKRTHAQFLMVGRRWDTDIQELIDFSNSDWEAETHRRALEANNQRDGWWIDYFAFSRGLYLKQLPSFGIGSVYWDNWLIWRAAKLRAAVVDASAIVFAVHQNHDYGHHPQGKQGVWTDEQSKRNFALAGGFKHMRTIASARFLLTEQGLVSNPFYWYPNLRFAMERRLQPARAFLQTWIWHPLLNLTRPLRHSIGLKQGHLLPGFLRRRAKP